jgi:hypothetical protein
MGRVERRPKHGLYYNNRHNYMTGYFIKSDLIRRNTRARPPSEALSLLGIATRRDARLGEVHTEAQVSFPWQTPAFQ